MEDEKEVSNDSKSEDSEGQSGDTSTSAQIDQAANPAPAKAKAKNPKPAKKKLRKKPSTKKKTGTGEKPVAKRNAAPFPAVSFEEALTIPNAIQKHAGGQKVRRLTLFEALDKSPDSGASRQLITNSGRYGLTTGGYQADFLELTALGKIASSVEASERERRAARFKLAIAEIAPFKAIYDRLQGNRLPTTSILEDIAKENGVPDQFARECVDTFIVNARFLGLLKTIAGAERLVSIEQVLEETPAASGSILSSTIPVVHGGEGTDASTIDWDKTCFYISPIGDPDSDHRKHSDLFLGSVVEPALEESGLTVVRADQIGKPGMITSQIIEHVLRSKLVIADLSYHNPNVFYELAVRHVCRLPTVQIIRNADDIPFDLDQFRTIQIDTTDIYSLVPKLPTYKAEIATQVRAALANPDSVDNPLSTYYPDLKVTF